MLVQIGEVLEVDRADELPLLVKVGRLIPYALRRSLADLDEARVLKLLIEPCLDFGVAFALQETLMYFLETESGLSSARIRQYFSRKNTWQWPSVNNWNSSIFFANLLLNITLQILVVFAPRLRYWLEPLKMSETFSSKRSCTRTSTGVPTCEIMDPFSFLKRETWTWLFVPFGLSFCSSKFPSPSWLDSSRVFGSHPHWE